jgi:hypothetical protein
VALAAAWLYWPASPHPTPRPTTKEDLFAQIALFRQSAIEQERAGEAAPLPPRRAPQGLPPPPSGVIKVALPFPPSIYALDGTGWQQVRGRHVTTVYVGAATSNRGFEQWGEILGDAMVAAALIDRLVHHATMITLKGKSYRLRERGLEVAPAAQAPPLRGST